jgi:malate/lactate dehydrogenase
VSSHLPSSRVTSLPIRVSTSSLLTLSSVYVLLQIDFGMLLTLCLQENGVEKIYPVGPLSAEEEKLLEACLPDLKKNIEKGYAFVA